MGQGAQVGDKLAKASALDLGTWAEGVEGPEQQRLLDTLGCEALPGFGCCRPLAVAAFEDWRRQRLADAGFPAPDASPVATPSV